MRYSIRVRGLSLIASLILFLGVFNFTGACAVSIDNDGKVRDNPYGDSKLASCYNGSSYIDCYVPYKASCEDIGGYATSATYAKKVVTTGGISAMSSTIRKSPVASNIARESSYSYASSNGWALVRYSNPTGLQVGVESETGLNVMTDKNGNQYYMTAVQPFFFNHDKAGKGGFPKNASGGFGQIFDVILTDGTCIHFVCMDINASQHTNGVRDSDGGSFDAVYKNSKLNYKQYNNLFSAQNGNTLELWGNKNCINGFKNKFNFGKGDGKNRIAYYRMYNKYVKDSPKRAGGVGKNTSFSYGNVTIEQSGDLGISSGSSLVVSEWDLVGMPEKSSLLSSMADVELPSYDALSSAERYALSVIKDDIVGTREAKQYDFIRTLVAFVGLWVVFYSVFLLVAYMFDKSNNLFDISLLRIVTFGKLGYAYDEDYANRKGYVRGGGILKVSVACLVVGLFIVSGAMFTWILNFIYWLVEIKYS